MPKSFSGKKVIKSLCGEFGFYFVSQKGSHVKLRKKLGPRIVTAIVPLHKELAAGTLSGVLKLAEVDEKEFRNKIR